MLLNIAGDAVAEVCLAPGEVVPARVNHQVALIRPQTGMLDAGYLRCYLASPAMQKYMRALSLQEGARGALTSAMIAYFAVPALPLERQRAIAACSARWSKKPPCCAKPWPRWNHGRALFLSWFVEFDPVHRNVRKSRHAVSAPETTDNLFPDSFEDSPLGKIPVGWCLTTIHELAKNIHGGLAAGLPDARRHSAHSRGEYLRRRRHLDQLSRQKITPREYERCRLLPGDILMARDGASIGNSLYLFADPDAVFADDLVRIRPARPEYARFISILLRTGAYADYLADRLARGANAPLDGQLLAGVPLILPPKKPLLRFNALLAPLDARIRQTAQEAMRLPQAHASLWAKLFPQEEEEELEEDSEL